MISQTVLKTINSIDEEDEGHEDDNNIENLSDLDTPVTIGAEFFPLVSVSSVSSCTSSTTSPIASIVQTASQLTCLTASGELLLSTKMDFFLRVFILISIFKLLKFSYTISFDSSFITTSI